MKQFNLTQKAGYLASRQAHDEADTLCESNDMRQSH